MDTQNTYRLTVTRNEFKPGEIDYYVIVNIQEAVAIHLYHLFGDMLRLKDYKVSVIRETETK